MTKKLPRDKHSSADICAIGLDFGGTNLKAGLVDSKGHLQFAMSEATPRTIEGFKALAESFITKLSSKADVGAVGIGCKGVVDGKTTMLVRSPGDLKHVEGNSLRELVSAAAGHKSVY